MIKSKISQYKKYLGIKSQITFLLIVSLLFSMIFTVNLSSVYASSTIINGITWNYDLVNGKAENVYTNSSVTGLVSVPITVNNYPVVSLGGGTIDKPFAPNGFNGIIIPSSVTKINDYAFYNISSLKSFSISEMSNEVYIPQTITSIGKYAFSGCSGISNLVLYDFVGSISDYAFSNCTSISKLYINNVSSLGNYAFKGDTGLIGLEINYPTITNQFQDCNNLINIVLNENVLNIGADAFSVTNLVGGIVKETGSANVSYGTSGYLSTDLLNTSSAPTSPTLKNVSGNKTRNWYFKNPNTVLQYQKVPNVTTVPNATKVKNNHTYFKSTPKVNTIGTKTLGAVSGKTLHLSWEGHDATSLNYGMGYNYPNDYIPVYQNFQTYTSCTAGNYYDATIVNATDKANIESKFFNSPAITNDHYVSNLTTDTKTSNQLNTVVSGSSNSNKTYITDESADIIDQKLSSSIFPVIATQYAQSKSQTYTLSNSLSSNGLSSSSPIYYNDYTTVASYNVKSTVALHIISTGGSSSTPGTVTKILTLSNVISNSTPDTFITTSTAGNYATGNGSSLNNGIYYNNNDGYYTNNIYVKTGECSDPSLKSDASTFSCHPEFVQTALSSTVYSNMAQNLVSIYDISSVQVPSYSPVAYKTGISADYNGTVQNASKVNPEQVMITVNYNLPNINDQLSGTQEGVYIIRSDKALKASYTMGKWIEDKANYDYQTQQNFMHVLEAGNGIENIDGINNVVVDSLGNGSYTANTNITIYYATGEYINVGKGGSYEYNENNELTPCSYLGQEEGAYDNTGNYIGLGGSYIYDPSTGTYTYDILGEYAPVIYSTTMDVLVVEGNDIFTASFNNSYFDTSLANEDGLIYGKDSNDNIIYIYDVNEKAFVLTKDHKTATLNSDMFNVKMVKKGEDLSTAVTLTSSEYTINPTMITDAGTSPVTISYNDDETLKAIVPLKSYAKVNDVKVGLDTWEEIDKSISDINDKLTVYQSELVSIQSILTLSTVDLLTAAAENETDETKKALLLSNLDKVQLLQTQIDSINNKIVSWNLGDAADDSGLTLSDYKDLNISKQAELAALGSTASDGFKQQFAILQQNIQNAVNELNNKENSLIALKEAMKLEDGYSEEDVAALASKLDNAQISIDQLNGLVTKYGLNLSNDTSAEDAINSYIKSLTDKITSLELAASIPAPTPTPVIIPPVVVNNDAAIANLQSQVNTLSTNNATLTSQLNTSKTELSNQQSKNTILNSENTSLKSKITTLTTENTKLLSQFNTLKKDYTDLKAANSGLVSKNNEYSLRFASLQSDYDMLSKNYNATVKANERLTIDNNNLKTVNEKLETENVALQTANSENGNINSLNIEEDKTNELEDSTTLSGSEDKSYFYAKGSSNQGLSSSDINNLSPSEYKINVSEDTTNTSEDVNIDETSSYVDNSDDSSKDGSKIITVSSKSGQNNNKLQTIIIVLGIATVLLGGIVFIIIKQNKQIVTTKKK